MYKVRVNYGDRKTSDFRYFGTYTSREKAESDVLAWFKKLRRKVKKDGTLIVFKGGEVEDYTAATIEKLDTKEEMLREAVLWLSKFLDIEKGCDKNNPERIWITYYYAVDPGDKNYELTEFIVGVLEEE